MANWSGWTEVKGDGRTGDAPAAAVYDGKLYVVARGVEDRVFYNSYDGGWSGWTEAGGNGRISAAPSAAVYHGELYVVVRGVQDRIYSNQLGS